MTFLELFDAAALTVKLCHLRTSVHGWCFKLNKDGLLVFFPFIYIRGEKQVNLSFILCGCINRSKTPEYHSTDLFAVIAAVTTFERLHIWRAFPLLQVYSKNPRSSWFYWQVSLESAFWLPLKETTLQMMTVTYGFNRPLCKSQAPMYLYISTIDSVFTAWQRVTENKILSVSVKSSPWLAENENSIGANRTAFRYLV